MNDQRNDKNTLEELRLQLLANGYIPIPNRDKRTFMKGWPGVVVDETEIRSWTRRYRRDRATGIRVEDGLCVIDFDIDHEIMDRIADRVFAEIPELGDPANGEVLVRRGKGRKEAWYVRTNEQFSRIHSRRWVAPGSSEDAGTHSVELFGGTAPRQFGSFGPHTVDDEGAVLVSYRWDGQSPADTPKRQLAAIDRSIAFRIADIVEEELEKAGFAPVLRSSHGENDAVRIYDLTDDMFFDLSDGRRLSLSELREVAQEQDGLRCSASWLEGPTAKRTDRCLISVTKAGHLAIWESASGITHLEKTAEPRSIGQRIELDRFAEQLKKLEARQRGKLDRRESALATAGRLLEVYAFCPSSKTPVVPIWTNALDAGITMQAFRTMLLPYCDEETGPRGGRVIINPVDIWAASVKRLTVAGTQMRPDQPRPTFTDERGDLWINSYDPPIHDAEGGSPDAGIEFIERLIPDERERIWWTRWLAYKVKHPWVPGPGVVMVAHGAFGTGRGTLKVFLGELLGRRYVKEMPYSMISGRTYQSQYTDWMVDALLVVVNESSETDHGASSYQTKRNTYERLKEIVEPSHTERVAIVRGRTAFHAMHCTSFVIATNHNDAIPIPAGDRRFAVLTNGEPQSPEYYAGFRAWMADPANLAAFDDYLRSYDLGGYSPYAKPLDTEAKGHMEEEAKSDLDHAIELAIQHIGSEVMTMEQVVAAVQHVARVYDLTLPDRYGPIAKKLARSVLHRIGVRDSTNWQVYINGRKLGVYATTKKVADYWRTRDGLREAVLKVGGTGNVIEGPFRGLFPQGVGETEASEGRGGEKPSV